MKTIQLTPEIEKLIKQHRQTGKYQNDLAVIQAGLDLLEERERIYQGRFEELKQEVMMGVEQLKQGKKLDGRDVITQLKQRNSQLIDNLEA